MWQGCSFKRFSCLSLWTDAAVRGWGDAALQRQTLITAHVCLALRKAPFSCENPLVCYLNFTSLTLSIPAHFIHSAVFVFTSPRICLSKLSHSPAVVLSSLCLCLCQWMSRYIISMPLALIIDSYFPSSPPHSLTRNSWAIHELYLLWSSSFLLRIPTGSALSSTLQTFSNYPVPAFQ